MLLAAAGLSAIGAAPANAAGFCIPLLMDCSSASPSPSPTATTGPSSTPSSPGSGSDSGSAPRSGDDSTGGGGGSGPSTATGKASGPSAGDAGAAPAAAWGPASPDDAVVFTMPAAQLSSSSIRIGGVPGISLVQVHTADGRPHTVVKLTADSVAMDDFLLDVRGESNGTSAVTADRRMELRGHVAVYLDSLTAELPGGGHLTLGADTPPPGGELPSSWLRVDLGLVGATADSITHTGGDLRVRAGSASGPTG